MVVDLVAYFERHGQALVETLRGIAQRAVVISSSDVYRAYGLLHGSESGPVEPVPLSENAPLRQMLHPYRSLATGPEDLAYHYEKIMVERAVMSQSDRTPEPVVRTLARSPGPRS